MSHIGEEEIDIVGDCALLEKDNYWSKKKGSCSLLHFVSETHCNQVDMSTFFSEFSNLLNEDRH
jgi:hypothetical protein